MLPLYIHCISKSDIAFYKCFSYLFCFFNADIFKCGIKTILVLKQWPMLQAFFPRKNEIAFVTCFYLSVLMRLRTAYRSYVPLFCIFSHDLIIYIPSLQWVLRFIFEITRILKGFMLLSLYFYMSCFVHWCLSFGIYLFFYRIVNWLSTNELSVSVKRCISYIVQSMLITDGKWMVVT